MKDEVKRLQRACSLIKEIWYLLRAATFHREFTNVKRVIDCDGIYMLELEVGENKWQPGRMWPCANDRDRQAVLCYLECGYSIIYMHDIADWLLGGLCTVIEEVVIELKPLAPRLSVQVEVRDPIGRTYVAENNTLGYTHVLWTIVLAGSEDIWTLDLTGPQYGWFEFSIRWDDYWPERCSSDERMYTNKFGTHRTIMEKKYPDMLGKEKADHEYRSELSDKLLYNLQRYCEQEGWTMEAVLGLSEEGFSVRREEILAEYSRVLQRVTVSDEQH